MLATETWEWLLLGMPWKLAVAIAVVGMVALAWDKISGDW